MDLIARALELGATHAAFIDAAKLDQQDELRRSCAQNFCGRYGTNWACPPAAPDMDDCREQVKSYTQGLVIQTVCPLEDSYDFEGMAAGQDRHNEIFRSLFREMRAVYGDGMLGLAAGGCNRCETCTYPDAPCRFPEELFHSVESYGIAAPKLCHDCGLNYINGANTVSYLGLILFA